MLRNRIGIRQATKCMKKELDGFNEQPTKVLFQVILMAHDLNRVKQLLKNSLLQNSGKMLVIDLQACNLTKN